MSQFLRTLAEATRVSKPVSNYGSEFEHISGGEDPVWDDGGPEFLNGPSVSIPADAQQTHHLNQELFGGGSEVDYVPVPDPVPVPTSAPAPAPVLAAQSVEVRVPDEVQSAEQGDSEHWQTPAEHLHQVSHHSPYTSVFFFLPY